MILNLTIMIIIKLLLTYSAIAAENILIIADLLYVSALF